MPKWDAPCQALQNYVTKLETQLKVFDWEDLPETLEQFPQIREALEQDEKIIR